MQSLLKYNNFITRLVVVVLLCMIFYSMAKGSEGLFFPALFDISLYGGIVWVFLGETNKKQ